MDCRILRHLTLKSDGHLSCDDSNGYYIHLGQVSQAPGWRLEHVLTGAVYQHVRSSLAQGRMPWPGVCDTCDCLSAPEPPVDTLHQRLSLMVEPTLDCQLQCPSCKRRQEAGRRPVHANAHLDPALLHALVHDLVRQGVALEYVHYLGWGEPLLHPRFAELVRSVHTLSPGTVQEVTTTGQADFRSSVGDAPLHRIVISCDGVNQAQYGRYRIGGNLARAMTFMADACRWRAPGTRVEWKYILFEHNDDDASLAQAQALADGLGVDSLLFIITNSKWASTRFTGARQSDFPQRSARASISPAAALLLGAKYWARAVLDDAHSAHPQALFYLDVCRLTHTDVLMLEGWCLHADGQPVAGLRLHLPDGRHIDTRPDLPRTDVGAALGASELPGITAAPAAGFLLRHPWPSQEPPAQLHWSVLGAQGGALFSLSVALRWHVVPVSA